MELVRWLTMAPVPRPQPLAHSPAWPRPGRCTMVVPPKCSGDRAAQSERVLVVQHRRHRIDPPDGRCLSGITRPPPDCGYHGAHSRAGKRPVVNVRGSR
jgi:hypothetical protein